LRCVALDPGSALRAVRDAVIDGDAVIMNGVATPIDLLLSARWVVPVEPRGVVLENHAVAVHQGAIVALLPQAEAHVRYRATQHIALGEHALLPGLVNAHTHNPMTLLRGLADDLPLMTWLREHIWPVEARVLGPEFVRDGTELAIAEMLRGGTTCANENYFFPDVSAATYRAHGFRAVVGLPIIEFPSAWARDSDEYFARACELADALRGDALVTAAFAPHAPYTVGDTSFARVRLLADQLDLPVHLHLHETAQEISDSLREHGQRPLARLQRMGLLNDRLIAVHMTQLTEAEIAQCAQAGVSVVHCPESNLKLASGSVRPRRCVAAASTLPSAPTAAPATTIWTCSARCAARRCWPRASAAMPAPWTPPARCTRPPSAARARWGSTRASARSCPASAPI